MLYLIIDLVVERDIVVIGLLVFLGVVLGKIVFFFEVVEEVKGNGEKVILVCVEISFEDIYGMYVVEGILIS